MSQFFLNIHKDGLAYPRLVAAHDNIEEVRQEARAVFADLVRSIVTGPDRRDWKMEVREDTGRLAYRIKLTMDAPK